MRIISIETSCDETACAIVENGRNVLSNVVATQIEEHRLYGGVVPEIASRRHCESICGVMNEALEQAGCTLSDMDAVAVTYAPGLIGALLVGVNYAKGLALGLGKPLIPVHHIKGHIAANYIAYPELKPPYLCLVVSGGHTLIVKVSDYVTLEVMGQTLDDAAGEAFDKAARAMGFPYPGGIAIDKAAKNGDPNKYKLPTPKTQNPYDFSFSGLKTAVLNLINQANQKNETLDFGSLSASFQNTLVATLADKFMAAARELKMNTLAISGGVAANSCLRETLELRAKEEGKKLYLPPLSLCGDNAAMIGCQAFYEYQAGVVADSALNAYATRSL
jgi:N6-L-threonylcarbamoyladenine synthase